MRTHKFILVLSGIADLTPNLADALFEAMKGDIELNMREGIAYLEVARAARTLHEAITSAIQDIDRVRIGVRVLRVESEVANTIAKINADLLEPARKVQGTKPSKTNR